MTRFVEWLAADLYRRGTRFAFGVPGGGVSLDLLDAAQTNGMRSVITAREDAAAIMAWQGGSPMPQASRSQPRAQGSLPQRTDWPRRSWIGCRL